MIACTTCGAGIEAGPLYRVGPQGGAPEWTCIACLNRPRHIDAETRAIVEAVHRGAASARQPGPYPGAAPLPAAPSAAAAEQARRAAQDAARGIRAVPLPEPRQPLDDDA